MWLAARKQEKFIRSAMVDNKRRAERRKKFYDSVKRDPNEFMQVPSSLPSLPPIFQGLGNGVMGLGIACETCICLLSILLLYSHIEGRI